MVPLGAVATFREITGPYRVPRYNLFPAAEVQGATLPGFSTGQAIAAMEQLVAANLPAGFGFEWTEIALQEKTAGNTAAVAFGLAVVFVFLLLAAQYESVLPPLAVILIVPMCLLAAISGVLRPVRATFKGTRSRTDLHTTDLRRGNSNPSKASIQHFERNVRPRTPVLSR
jgi:HAE1 family hydrophobic/amphiphilic exporter-1